MGEQKRALVVEVESSGLTWRKSSASGSGGQGCIEMALGPDTVLVRCSRDRHGQRILLIPEAWTALLAATRDGALAC